MTDRTQTLSLIGNRNIFRSYFLFISLGIGVGFAANNLFRADNLDPSLPRFWIEQVNEHVAPAQRSKAAGVLSAMINHGAAAEDEIIIALENAMKDTDANVRRSALVGLRNAKNSTQYAKSLTYDSDSTVRSIANAMLQGNLIDETLTISP